jgi:transposase
VVFHKSNFAKKTTFLSQPSNIGKKEFELLLQFLSLGPLFNYKPLTFRTIPYHSLLQSVRLKYACLPEPEKGVTIASLPKRIIPKGNAGESLLSHILISKYVDHLPLDRMEKILKRSGIRIAKSTMSDWIQKCTLALDPLRLALQDGRSGSK